MCNFQVKLLWQLAVAVIQLLQDANCSQCMLDWVRSLQLTSSLHSSDLLTYCCRYNALCNKFCSVFYTSNVAYLKHNAAFHVHHTPRFWLNKRLDILLQLQHSCCIYIYIMLDMLLQCYIQDRLKVPMFTQYHTTHYKHLPDCH